MEKQLGQVVSEHHGRLAAGGLGWVVAGVMFVGSLVGAFKAVAAGNEGDILYFATALVVLAGVLLWLFSRWKQSLVIHTEGFRWKRLLRADVSVRYDEIASVEVRRFRNRRSLHQKGEHSVVDIALKNGKFVVLTNDIENAEQLAGYAGHAPANVSTTVSPPAASPWA